MSKVEWKKDKVIYRLSENENPFVNDFFTFYQDDEKLNETFLIKVIDEKIIEIEGNFSEGIILKVNKINYLFNYEEPKTKEKTENEVQENYAGVISFEENIIEFDDENYKVPNFYELSLDEDKIKITNLKEEKITFQLKINDVNINKEIIPLPVKIEQFTNETYPDFPYKKYKLNINNSHTIERKTNVIYKIKIDNTTFIIKDNPRFYWSNVKDLKEFLVDSNLQFHEKSDERLKKLIQEKSVYLKRRFGLAKMHIFDVEYFPLYKKLVNLYCLYDIVSLNFINGVNGDLNINPINGGYMYGGASLKLGNFQTGQEGGTTGNVLTTQLVKGMINLAEKDLYASLFKKHGTAYRQSLAQRGGCFCVKQIFLPI